MHIKFTDLVVKCICVRNVSRMLKLADGIIGKKSFWRHRPEASKNLAPTV